MRLLNFKKYKTNRGMTYVELIVVLTIFSIMSSIVIFNYGDFQARVDIKNLANDIALRIVEAQKSAIFGKFPSPDKQIGLPSTWKPSYGIYINKTADNKSFVYFVDLDRDNVYDGPDCISECVDKIIINKGNVIETIEVFYIGGTTVEVNDITMTFVRPSTEAIITSVTSVPPLSANISHVQITIKSPKSAQSKIKVYSSGRIQIN